MEPPHEEPNVEEVDDAKWEYGIQALDPGGEIRTWIKDVLTFEHGCEIDAIDIHRACSKIFMPAAVEDVPTIFHVGLFDFTALVAYVFNDIVVSQLTGIMDGLYKLQHLRWRKLEGCTHSYSPDFTTFPEG